MAGTQYAYPTNLTWEHHPIGTGPCTIQVQDGGTCLVHFGTIVGDPTVYEGVMHHHFETGEEVFRYTGNEEVWVRSHANNIEGIKQTCKIVCTPL